MNCKRCGEYEPLYVVGERYCRQCKREMAPRLTRTVVAIPEWRKRLIAKDMTDWRPVA